MPSTSVHVPEDLLRRLDRVAKRRRVSRNRLIVDACRAVAGEGRGEWPEGFFAHDRLSSQDRKLLSATFRRWLGTLAARRSRAAPPF